jgi:hypothetical protein
MLRSEAVEKVSDRGRVCHLDIVGAPCYTGYVVQRFLNEWGALPPKLRFGIRAGTAAVGGALAGAYLAGDITDWASLKGALITVGLKLVVGLFTPEEPFVGFNKPEEISVPADSTFIEN